MIPDIVCIWVSFFLAQRPSSAPFLLARRCHSTWRNAGVPFNARNTLPIWISLATSAFFNCLLKTFDRLLLIKDFTLDDTFRLREARPQNFNGASRPDLADDGTDFAGADIKSSVNCC
jgi:hypothetical protein